MQKRDLIQANASLENLRQNLDMKDFAKEILLEENYNKFIDIIQIYILVSINRCISWIYSAISCSSCYF